MSDDTTRTAADAALAVPGAVRLQPALSDAVRGLGSGSARVAGVRMDSSGALRLQVVVRGGAGPVAETAERIRAAVRAACGPGHPVTVLVTDVL